METTKHQNTAALIHLSTLSQYFIPFGNFIFPLILWNTNKHKSEYVDQQGKQAVNFQLSLFLYALVLCLISLPILFFTILKNLPLNEIINGNEIGIENFHIPNLTGMAILAGVAIFLVVIIKVIEFCLIIYATVRTSNGEPFKYPVTIPFIK
ncbi:DUF4870 domain-containing protein [Flavobacterium sp. GT3R68]|uniref:DUF4870 domain-containing protein n=1 Tax=Flavobacterium sp. GT3R68 TaxID=2594437 RepID=UPI000F894BA2|nr:DUF4870 domain-containing protein [Flavobacterium sp. GT3R68]RTY93425.1 DUF4870 domain-containing protein [Flavobacterium sp. GSN2]TRW92402.1 DUF4870 domain-containing protein [Flavobacterium sp. GT3R68]